MHLDHQPHHALGLSFAETDRFSTASMITRLTQDVQQVQQMIGMSLRMLVRQPFMLVGGISMAMHIHPKLALILLVLIPPLIVLVTITFKYSRPMFMAIQTKTDALNAVLQENLTGVRVVKAFVREDYESEKFGKSNKSLADQHLTTSRFMSGMMPAMMFLMNLGIIAVLWIGGWTIRRGELTVGEVVAMVNYITQILFSFMFASFIMTDIARSKVSAERLNEVLDSETSVRNDGTLKAEATTGGGTSVVFDHVTFRYPGASGPAILQDISFELKPGETMAILGSTGSGKSTLVHLLPRFYDIDSGMVAIDGHNVQDYELSELRSLMGMVLQESVLFSGTIAENIRWGNPDATDEQVVEVAKAAQAYEFITRFKDGFKTKVNTDSSSLATLFDIVIGNSFEHAKGMTRLEFSLTNAPEPSSGTEMLKISIADDGCGTDLDWEKARRAFSKQDDVRTVSERSKVSLGLGLSVADKIVTRAGGNISITSKPGRGTCTTMWFPCE